MHMPTPTHAHGAVLGERQREAPLRVSVGRDVARIHGVIGEGDGADQPRASEGVSPWPKMSRSPSRKSASVYRRSSVCFFGGAASPAPPPALLRFLRGGRFRDGGAFGGSAASASIGVGAFELRLAQAVSTLASACRRAPAKPVRTSRAMVERNAAPHPSPRGLVGADDAALAGRLLRLRAAGRADRGAARAPLGDTYARATLTHGRFLARRRHRPRLQKPYRSSR